MSSIERKSQKKDDVITMDGVVTERLPNAMFRVKLENEYEVLAHSCGKIKKNKITIVIGDEVVVELSVYDTSKGRIITRKPVNRQPDPNK